MVRRAMATVAVATMATAVLGSDSSATELPEDSASWSSGLVLIGAIVVAIGAIYLVQWQDSDIRKEGWGLVNKALSLFCAAGIDFGLCQVFITLLLPEKEWHDPEHSLTFLGFIFLMVLLAPVILHHWILRTGQQQDQRFFGLSTLGAHIIAFLGVLSFGKLQQVHVCPMLGLGLSCWIDTAWVWLIPLVAFLYMWLVYQGLALCRKVCRKEMQDHGHAFEHAMVEACAITVSCLLVQGLCYVMSVFYGHATSEAEYQSFFMPIMTGLPPNSIKWCIPYLLLTAIVSMAFSFVWSWCFGHKRGFCLKSIQDTLPIIAAWAIQRSGVIWFFGATEGPIQHFMEEHHCPDSGHTCHEAKEHAMIGVSHTHIINALVMSIVAVTGLCLIDTAADRLERNDASDMEESSESEAESEGSKHQEVVHGLRMWGTGFAVLVGISWEKAFDASFEMVLIGTTSKDTMEESDPVKWFASTHPKTARVLVASLSILLSLFVLPAWYRYIVPNAMKDENAHAEDLRGESGRLERLEVCHRPTDSE